MPVLTFNGGGSYHRFDKTECEREGAARATRYRQGQPFPHIVMDDFLDTSLLREVADHYPSIEGREHFDRDHERLKYQFQPLAIDASATLNLLAELNSEAFIAFLEKMTGIEGLIPDPYFAGGGLHLTRRGGHLSVHADFNVHQQMKLERRLNLLIYLNDDWDERWGGGIELWDEGVTACQVRVAPLLGRALVFNTTLKSFHGHPDPLQCPDHRDRRSIATYYYTAFPAGLDGVLTRNTNFQPRPASGDRRDWHIGFDHLIGDWVPPRLQRYARRLNPFRAS